MQTLYRGSRVEVKQPEIRVQRFHKDFFGGFYCTKIEEQASRWANVLDVLFEVFTSWIDERISDFNSAFYYQPRDYVAACWLDGAVIDG